MEDKNVSLSQEKNKLHASIRTDLVVHAFRIGVKLSIVACLYIGKTTYFVPLAVYLLVSEILDQVSIYMSKLKPEIKKYVSIFYVFNSVVVITTVGFFAHWVTNDYYLIYLVHISSSLLAYGFKIGLFSYGLSVVSYLGLLLISSAPVETYIRIPLVTILVWRLLLNQRRFETTENFLSKVLSIERSKQDFIALASHNLRTPVAAIYGYLDVLLRGDAGVLNKQQEDFVQKVKLNNQELEKTTESLLQISIFEVGAEVNLLKQPSQIEILIQNVVDKFIMGAKDKGLDLSYQKEIGSLPLVNIDVEKITAVLSNLIDNAIKYTEKGAIIISTSESDNFINISVKDTGIGIPSEDLPKIFSKFFRSGNVLIYNQTGLGLGLYLGKQIIELHGGQIEVDSIVNKGTTVKFTLPIMKKEEF